MNEYPGLDRVFLWEWAAQFSSQRQRRLPLPSANTVTTSRAGETRSSIANGAQPASGQPPSAEPEQTSFLNEKDGAPYQAHGRNHIHYSVEWRVELDTKILATQSESNVAVSPSCYWRHVLKGRFEQAVRRAFVGDRQPRHEHTTVVVSVTDPAQGDLTKRYAGLEIDWAAADNHLLDWSSYFRRGNALRVTLTFQFVAPNPPAVQRSVTPRGDGGRHVSASGRMPVPRRQESAMAQEQQGRPPFLYDLCVFMRCPTSCLLGPYCWVNSKGVHHRMTPECFKLLEAHVTHYGMPASHSDMPLDVQRQLVMDRQAQAWNAVPGMPVQIGNVSPGRRPQAQLMGVYVGQDYTTLRRQSDGALPTQRDLTRLRDDPSMLRRQSDGDVPQQKGLTGFHDNMSAVRRQPNSTGTQETEITAVDNAVVQPQQPHLTTADDVAVQLQQTKLSGNHNTAVRPQPMQSMAVHDAAVKPQPSELTGPHDDELRDYATWQQSRVQSPWLKDEFGKAFDVAVRNGFTLDLLYENADPHALIDEGVFEGVACYFCRRRDIDRFRDRKRRLSADTDTDTDTGMGEDQT
ncbi:hypothetical protein G647_08648 [Cladophialophora carrionii CBS 160.54]|uniref:Uncharacterized protein n=1 Tax=Cladophialophora carrionii CBS 160.54 TaxID=1279043 RepID=V9D149_9EURO|nr:uncharacterized protein G647_08648 [Cladophialophora carrionii CBS 160.54]ETI20610.1 hypothetical protein G647_08648 [Cladophialophora carrionii CBS 160.54]